MSIATGPTRVVFAAHAFPRHQGDLTGAFLLRLAEALEREGIEVEAVVPAAPGFPARDRFGGVAVQRYRYAPRWAETIAYTGGMHSRVANPVGAVALVGLLGAGTLALRRAAAEADLVHAHWWFPGGVQALAAGRRPLVTTMHGTDVRLARSRPAAQATCARVLRASAAITTVSSWLRDEVAAFAPEVASRIRVAPMPVDEGLFWPGDEPRTELLFVGRLDGQKGADLAICALAGLQGAAASLPLRLVGSGPLEPDLRRLAAELGVADRLRWEGPLSQAELAARYRRAAALLVPGSHEGFGLVAVEAQLSGAPVIAAASGGLLDLIRTGETGWTFPPDDPIALTTAIQQVTDHPIHTVMVTQAARQSATTRFSPTTTARAYATIYAEAIATHSRSRTSPSHPKV
jgi:glycosyltransferase involved in cell wall biosynthesis